MLKDRYGYKVATASMAARDAYVSALDRLLSADAGIEQGFRDAIAADEGFALAHVGLARALQVLGRGAEAAAPFARAMALAESTGPRERSQLAIFEKIIGGQGAVAVPMILEHAKAWPRDAMAVAPITGVFGLIGFSGKVGREAEQVAVLKPLAQAYGDDWWFRTVLAFAEGEYHQFDDALRNIDVALRGNPRNAHAAHIRAHIHYELGERADGLRFLQGWATGYSREGLMHCHISWHQALWSLESGRPVEAWRVYDRDVQPGGAWGPPLNVLTDAASFLARAEMAGETVDPARWRIVADYAAKWFPNSGMIFADMHSALAFAMAGDTQALRVLVENPKGPVADLLPSIARGFEALARKDWQAVSTELRPLLETHERVGGSRAQRDLLEYSVTLAMLRTGGAREARAFIAARRPNNGKDGFPLVGL